MLKGIPDCISPELLKVLHEMGHGDRLVLADANFPAASIVGIHGHKNIRCDGHDLVTLLGAILEIFPLDAFVPQPVILMTPATGDPGFAKAPDKEALPHSDGSEGANWGSSSRQAFVHLVCQHDDRGESAVACQDRLAFYETARQAYAVVSTTERAPYACMILQKGCL